MKFSPLGQKRIFGFDSSLAEQEESDFFLYFWSDSMKLKREIFFSHHIWFWCYLILKSQALRHIMIINNKTAIKSKVAIRLQVFIFIFIQISFNIHSNFFCCKFLHTPSIKNSKAQWVVKSLNFLFYLLYCLPTDMNEGRRKLS